VSFSVSGISTTPPPEKTEANLSKAHRAQCPIMLTPVLHGISPTVSASGALLLQNPLFHSFPKKLTTRFSRVIIIFHFFKEFRNEQFLPSQ
jgi:hypothetical protein